MIELTRHEVEDLFISYKNNQIDLEQAVDVLFLWQSENNVSLNSPEVKE